MAVLICFYNHLLLAARCFDINNLYKSTSKFYLITSQGNCFGIAYTECLPNANT